MKNWYIVQSHSSFENKVAQEIKDEATKADLMHRIEEIIVPTHDITEVKRGKRVQRKKKFFPGYILIKSEMDNNIYHMIKNLKKVSGFIKLQIKGGQANPAPPVGPALGQRGVNIMEFCKAFNDKTKSLAGKPVPVEITVYKDKKFDFKIKSPPASFFIREAAKLKSGSQEPGRNIVASITKKQAEEIAKQKMNDLNAIDLDQAVKIIAGSARSMGIEVKD